MNKKKIISIAVTILVIVTVAVLIIHKNNSTIETVISENNIEKNEVDIPSEEPTIEQNEEQNEEITPTPIATTPSSKPTTTTTTTSSSKYYIKINNQMNTVTIYTKDENGNYTVPIKAMICSTGQVTPQNSTYTIQKKYTDTSCRLENIIWTWRI